MGNHKHRHHDGNKGWTDKNVLKCKTIGNRAGAFVWLCNTTSESYETRETIIRFGFMSFTFLLSVAAIPSMVWESNTDLIKISIGIIAGLTAMEAFAQGVVEWLDYPKSIKKHGWASSQYSNQFLEIDRTVNMEIKRRPRFNAFYQKIKKTEFSLKRKTPYVPPRIFKEYYKKLGSKALRKEVLFGDVNLIDVYIDEDKSTIAHDKPATKEITQEIKRTQTQRHKHYRKEMKRSKSNDIARARFQTHPLSSSLGSIKRFLSGEALQIEHKDDSNSDSSSSSSSSSSSNSSSLSDSEKSYDYRQAKKLSERRRYELDRYFIEGKF